MGKDWEPDVTVHAGKFVNEKRGQSGKMSQCDFEENWVEISLGKNLYWRGTSQEFKAEWEEI